MKRRDFLLGSAGLAGSVIPAAVFGQSKPCSPSPFASQGGASVTTACTPSSAAADWATRISGPGVVWYHPFASADEVKAFTWASGYNGSPGGSGNDPYQLSRAPNYDSSLINLNTTDGPAPGFNCMEIIRAAGTQETSHWWRPLSPMQGGNFTNGNGRGAGNNDPGAAGTIAARAWSPITSGETSNWGMHGYYANQQYVTANPAPFDGTEYYIQARVKIDPNRAQGINTLIDGGKLFYFTRTDRSLTDQECVTTSFHGTTGSDYFSIYYDGGVGWIFNGNGSSFKWPLGQWATVLFHVKPGTLSGALGSGLAGANPDTVFEAWYALAGQTGYTQIFSRSNFAMPQDLQYGHNALICSTYQNGSNMTQFYHRIAQIIFSKQFIPCPQV